MQQNLTSVNKSLDTQISIAGLTFKNPVITASGTSGYGYELNQFYDLSQLGGFTTKTITLKPRIGNAPGRIAETPYGMLNSIGLQNPGIEKFLEIDLPALQPFDTRKIVSISGDSVEEFALMAHRLEEFKSKIDLIELNVSCPNVEKGGLSFGADPDATRSVVQSVKKKTTIPVTTKLSPNVTDIKAMAKAAEEGGSDAITLINTLLGAAIDINTRRFKISRKVAGFSGPAIKPVALRMVWEAKNAVRIPIIGMGGIATAEDALEFILAGASLVAVGTAQFINPYAGIEIIRGIEDYMVKYNVSHLKDLIGTAQ